MLHTYQHLLFTICNMVCLLWKRHSENPLLLQYDCAHKKAIHLSHNTIYCKKGLHCLCVYVKCVLLLAEYCSCTRWWHLCNVNIAVLFSFLLLIIFVYQPKWENIECALKSKCMNYHDECALLKGLKKKFWQTRHFLNIKTNNFMVVRLDNHKKDEDKVIPLRSRGQLGGFLFFTNQRLSS